MGGASSDERLSVSRDAVQIARTAGNHQVLAEALPGHGRLLVSFGLTTGAQQPLEQARNLAVESNITA